MKKNQVNPSQEKDFLKPGLRDPQGKNLLRSQEGVSSPSPRPSSTSMFPLDADLMNILTTFVKNLNLQPECERRLLNEIQNCQTQENLTQNIQKKASILETVSRECQNALQYLTSSQSIIKIQAYIRSWTVLSDFKKLRKLYSTVSWIERNAEFRELLNKERVYVNTLQHTVDNYLIPLRNEKILKPEQIQSIFTNIEALLVVHQELLRFFEKVYANWPHLVGIGDAFVKIAPSLRVYGTYVENCSHASLTLSQLSEEHEKFRQFLDNVSKSNSMGLQLQGLLFLPLNRISQYKISLENLLNKTPKKHHDYAALARASDMMEKAYNFIENSMASSKARADILRIQQKLIGYLGELYQPGRHLIKEGSALSLEKGKKQQRNLYLFNDMLLVTKPEKTGSKVKYIVTFHPHDDVGLEYDKEGKSFPIKLTSGLTPNDKMTYVFIFKTDPERRQWIDAINTQLKSVKMKNTVVFGCPLADLLKKDPKQGKIPLILKLLTSEIEKHLKTQGLFRVPGNEAAKRKLREELDSLDPKVDWKNVDPLTMADVLKTYFRELPQPLFTFELYDRFMAIESEAQNEDDYKRRLAMVIEKLPPENKAVLVFLLQHLIKVAHVPENMMSSTSLAIIFAPGVLRPKNETIEHTFLIPRAHRIFQTLMDDFTFFFKETAPQAKVPSGMGAHRPKKKVNPNRLLMGTLRSNPLEDSSEFMIQTHLSTSSSSSSKAGTSRGLANSKDSARGSNNLQSPPVVDSSDQPPVLPPPPPPPPIEAEIPPPLPENVPLPPPIDASALPPPLPVVLVDSSSNETTTEDSPQQRSENPPQLPPRDNVPLPRPKPLPKIPPRLVNSTGPRLNQSPRGQQVTASSGQRPGLPSAPKKAPTNGTAPPPRGQPQASVSPSSPKTPLRGSFPSTHQQ